MEPPGPCSPGSTPRTFLPKGREPVHTCLPAPDRQWRVPQKGVISESPFPSVASREGDPGREAGGPVYRRSVVKTRTRLGQGPVEGVDRLHLGRLSTPESLQRSRRAHAAQAESERRFRGRSRAGQRGKSKVESRVGPAPGLDRRVCVGPPGLRLVRAPRVCLGLGLCVCVWGARLPGVAARVCRGSAAAALRARTSVVLPSLQCPPAPAPVGRRLAPPFPRGVGPRPLPATAPRPRRPCLSPRRKGTTCLAPRMPAPRRQPCSARPGLGSLASKPFGGAQGARGPSANPRAGALDAPAGPPWAGASAPALPHPARPWSSPRRARGEDAHPPARRTSPPPPPSSAAAKARRAATGEATSAPKPPRRPRRDRPGAEADRSGRAGGVAPTAAAGPDAPRAPDEPPRHRPLPRPPTSWAGRRSWPTAVRPARLGPRAGSASLSLSFWLLARRTGPVETGAARADTVRSPMSPQVRPGSRRRRPALHRPTQGGQPP